MKTTWTTTLALLLGSMLLAGSALAKEHPYLAVDASLGTFELNDKSASPQVIRLRGGTDINEYLGVEAHLGLPMGSDTIEDSSTLSFDVNVHDYYSVFLKAGLLQESIALYVLGGMTTGVIDVKSSNPSVSPSDRGSISRASFGAGVDLHFSKSWAVSADYIDYFEGYTAVSVGLKKNF